MKMARISPRVQHLKERRCPIQSPSSSNSSLNGHARIQAPQGSHFSISGTGKSKPPFFMTILPMDNIKRICRSRCNASRQPFRQHSSRVYPPYLVGSFEACQIQKLFSLLRPTSRKDPVYPLRCIQRCHAGAADGRLGLRPESNGR